MRDELVCSESVFGGSRGTADCSQIVTWKGQLVLALDSFAQTFSSTLVFSLSSPSSVSVSPFFLLLFFPFSLELH